MKLYRIAYVPAAGEARYLEAATSEAYSWTDAARAARYSLPEAAAVAARVEALIARYYREACPDLAPPEPVRLRIVPASGGAPVGAARRYRAHRRALKETA